MGSSKRRVTAALCNSSIHRSKTSQPIAQLHSKSNHKTISISNPHPKVHQANQVVQTVGGVGVVHRKCRTSLEWRICNLARRDATLRATQALWKSPQDPPSTRSLHSYTREKKNKMMMSCKMISQTKTIRFCKKRRRSKELLSQLCSRWRSKSSCIRSNRPRSMRLRTSSKSLMSWIIQMLSSV